MSKLIVITTSEGKRIAIRKDLITFVTENGTDEEPTNLWVKGEYEDNPYGCRETLNEVLAKLEE